jgi:hypothetical protein
MNFFLTMTDTITSQNIDHSFFITLYIVTFWRTDSVEYGEEEKGGGG